MLADGRGFYIRGICGNPLLIFLLKAMEYTASVVFTKLGEMKYISHLDLLRLLSRALRRAGLPFALSLGFTKRPRISIKRALKLGLESENEEAEIILREEVPASMFIEKLQGELPEGIKIREAFVTKR